MEVDLPTVAPGPNSSQPPAAAPAPIGVAQLVVFDSGSSTEVEEDEDGDGGETAARVPPRPPPTWAFSQRAVGSVGSSAPVNSAGPDGPIRRRIRLAKRTPCSEHCGCNSPEVTVCLCACVRATDRVSGCTTPARQQRPLEASQTFCYEPQPLAWRSRSRAAPRRSATLMTRRSGREVPPVMKGDQRLLLTTRLLQRARA